MDSASVSGITPTQPATPAANWVGPVLDSWDLLIVGHDVAGIEAALEAADFQGRLGLVDQRARSIPLTGAHNAGLALQGGNYQANQLGGWAVFTGPHTVAIHGREVAFHRAILATGARWDTTDIAGLETIGFATPESLDRLGPSVRQVAVIGAGPRACEAAQALRQRGLEVHLATEASGLLEEEEPAAAAAAQRALEADGVRLHLGFRPVSAEPAGRVKALTVQRDAVRQKLLVDEIVFAAARRANVDRMGLEAAGIRRSPVGSRGAVGVDSRLATSNARVFAVGGIATPDRYAEGLERMCRVAIQNAIGSTRQRFDPFLVPRLVSTKPQIARVGLTAVEARSRGIAVESWLIRLDESNATPERIDVAAEKSVERPVVPGRFAIIHAASDLPGRIVGATLVGAHAAEGIGSVVLLMTEELPLSALARGLAPTGTFSRALARSADLIERRSRSSRRAR